MAIAFENVFENLLVRYRASPASRFLAWWKEELLQLLPDHWRTRLIHDDLPILISSSDNNFLFWNGEPLTRVLEFSSSQDTGLFSQQFAELQHDEDNEDPEVVLLVEPHNVLRSSAVLPLAAERNLRQALSYDLDRQTPFAATDVYFDFVITERNRETGQIHLDLFVVPRDHLNSLLGTLKKAGVGVHRVDVSSGESHEGTAKPLGLNLLPPADRARRQNRRFGFNIMLALVTLLITALVMVQSLYIRSNQVAAMEDALDSIRQEARQVATMEQQYQDSLAAAQFLSTRRAGQAYTVDLLADVTRVIPDNTYLQRVTVKDNLIRLQGLSDAAQRLLTNLNESKMLINASFETSQINVDARTGKERFNMSATVVPLIRSPQAQKVPSESGDAGQGPGAAGQQTEMPAVAADNTIQEQSDETAAGE